MAQAQVQAPHVLVVDDDDGIRGTIAEILESEGYDVATAVNGLAALARIAERAPSLILLDLQMPGMSGWEVLGRLREQGTRIPVVFMTAGYRAQAEAARHNAEGHLGKPFEMDDLLAVVARLTGHTPSP
jgi:two-component system, chemotaxis family, chemotaxis protein CheY